MTDLTVEALARLRDHTIDYDGSPMPLLAETFPITCGELIALLDIAEAVAQQCVWTQDDHDESWDSACGEKWQFTADGPAENNVRFCHGCGHKVRIVPCTGGGE